MIRRVIGVGITGSVLAAGLLTTTAGAAGTSYGGTAPLTQGVPGGFTAIIEVISIPPKGGTVTTKDDSVKIVVVIGKNNGENLVITGSTISSLKSASIKNLPRGESSKKPIFGSGFSLSKNSKTDTNSGLVVVTLKSSTFTKGDYIVVYSSKDHAFVPAPKNFARVVNGVATIKSHSGEDFAVLGKKS